MRLICVLLSNLLLLSGCLMTNVDRENSTRVIAPGEDFEYTFFDTSDLFQTLQMAKDARFAEFVKV